MLFICRTTLNRFARAPQHVLCVGLSLGHLHVFLSYRLHWWLEVVMWRPEDAQKLSGVLFVRLAACRLIRNPPSADRSHHVASGPLLFGHVQHHVRHRCLHTKSAQWWSIYLCCRLMWETERGLTWTLWDLKSWFAAHLWGERGDSSDRKKVYNLICLATELSALSS